MNKSNTTNLIKSLQKTTSEDNTNKDIKIDIDEIVEIFNNNTLNQIYDKYSTKQLSNMYFSIYSKMPSSSYKKMRIVENIKTYVNSINRIDGFNNL